MFTKKAQEIMVEISELVPGLEHGMDWEEALALIRDRLKASVMIDENTEVHSCGSGRK